jgi:hypothetical protein
MPAAAVNFALNKAVISECTLVDATGGSQDENGAILSLAL